MTAAPPLTFQFPEKIDFLFTPHRYKVAWGGRGSGKSWAFARALLILGIQKPMKILCAREYQNSLAESVYALLLDQIQSMGFGDFYESTKSEITGKNGTRIFFAGLKTNPRSIKSVEGIDLAWVEEAENVSKESWDLLVPTIRKEGSEIWATFNPNRKSDDTYQRFIDHPPDNAIVRQINWRDNPWFPDILRLEKDNCKRTSMADYLHTWEGMTKEDAGTTKLKPDWLQTWIPREWTGMNIYVTVDPANSKGSKSDYTVFTAWGLGPDSNYYILEQVRERYDIYERIEKAFDLYLKYRPIRFGWEQTGMSSDSQVLKREMDRRNFRFNVVEIKPPSGVTKEARIEAALLPIARDMRLWIPQTQSIVTLDGRSMDLTAEFRREWEAFPNADGDLIHDDMLDSAAMIMAPEMQATFPNMKKIADILTPRKKEYNPFSY